MDKYYRIIVILLFALTFAVCGYLAPLLYATAAPQPLLIESHEVTATDTTVATGGHTLCFDRTVHNPAPGESYTELYMVSESGKITQVERTTVERFFESGRETILIQNDLPDDIEQGEYRYLLIVQLDLANERVTRTMRFESNMFTVHEEGSNIPTEVGNC